MKQSEFKENNLLSCSCIIGLVLSEMSSFVMSEQQQQLVFSLIEELRMARERDKIERERFQHLLPSILIYIYKLYLTNFPQTV